MRTIILITCALILLCAAAPAAVEVDLLTGGDFEAGAWSADLWEGEGGGALATDIVHSGLGSLHMHGAGAATVVSERTFSLVSPDEPVTVSGYWKGAVTEGTGGRIVVRWLNGDGEKVRDDPLPTKAGEFDWTQFSESLTPPANAARGRIFLEIWRTTGDVWYDDVRITQGVVPLSPAEITFGSDPATITVGVFDADAAGGRGYGGPSIHAALSAVPNVRAELLDNLSLRSIGRCDAIVLPNVHDIGRTGAAALLARNPQVAWMADARAALSAYVHAGGGIILTHMSNGEGAFTNPLFPQVVSVAGKSFDTRPVAFANHPVTAGLQPFDPTFEDIRVLQAGPRGEVIMRNGSGQAVGVGGEAGVGRVVGIGLCPGIDKFEKPAPVSESEARLLANALTWVAARSRPGALIVAAPNVTELTEPGEDLDLSVAIVPLAVEPGGELDLRLRMRGETKSCEPASMEQVQSQDSVTLLRVTFDGDALGDGVSWLEVATNLPGAEEPRDIAQVVNRSAFARFADGLPKCHFTWSAMNVHGPSALRTEADIAEMARMAREMHFKAVLFAAKPPDAYLYYNTEIGEKAPGYGDLDPLALAVKYCHQEGLQLLVQFCTFQEGSAQNPSKFIREHPDWADWDPGDGPDLSKHQNGIFGCPDRREVRDYELSLIREMAQNYDIDGISFDYIRYKNDRYCVCPHSEHKFAEYRAAHPELSEAQARAAMAEQSIVSFTWEVRELLDEVKPNAILHGYCHPAWANKFPLQYLSFRASAHGADPSRGGEWPLEKVYEQAKRNVDLADDHVEFMKAAPMADTAYRAYAKSPERYRRELRLINHAGADAVMIYLYSTLRYEPSLREAIAVELAEP
ncbi:MAG TPA: hypothetical protein DGT21_07285 [Armatimonadetes bacterium]|nr:hypothetical protein [Armatimonadota bacterium]